MNVLKSYYAYLGIAAGIVIKLAMLGGTALAGNWMLELVAYAVISAGALSQQQASPWFRRASITADVLIGFTVVCGPAVLPPYGGHRQEYGWLVPLPLRGCTLLLAAADQMRAAGRQVVLEWVLVAVWSTGYILWLVMAFDWLEEPVVAQGIRIASMLLPLAHVALLVDMFRAQQQYIRMEVDKS